MNPLPCVSVECTHVLHANTTRIQHIHAHATRLRSCLASRGGGRSTPPSLPILMLLLLLLMLLQLLRRKPHQLAL